MFTSDDAASFSGSLKGRHTILKKKKNACVRVKFRDENLRVHNIYQANEPSALQVIGSRLLSVANRSANPNSKHQEVWFFWEGWGGGEQWGGTVTYYQAKHTLLWIVRHPGPTLGMNYWEMWNFNDAFLFSPPQHLKLLWRWKPEKLLTFTRQLSHFNSC